MARNTVAGCAGKTVVQVTLGTGNSYVGARERESCSAIVVKAGSFPLRRIVASCAILGEAGRNMIWIRRRIECGLVAADALGSCS